jgi:NTE family protein
MGPMTTSKRIAIACQGGGSQCAFVAGALKTLLARGVHERFRIVGLSGTSGGALTAALGWIDMLKQANGDPTPIGDRIIAFWNDLTAQTPREIAVDKLCVQMQRLVERGLLPSFASSPSSPSFQLATRALAKLIGRPEFTDLRALLVKHIDFDALSSLAGPDGPVLLVGAADVLEGTFKIFSSVRGEIQVDSLLASAAIPNLFPAVQIDGHAYWDGIFSTNPPVFAFLQEAYMGKDMRPEEIWIIQVNRAQHDFVPEMPSDIFDRRNHLAGNLSLQHELQLVDMVNLLLQEGALTDRFRARFGLEATTAPIVVRFIRMSRELQRGLDYPSKLSRQPAHIARLIADGEAQADAFLNGLDDGDRLLGPDLTESLDGDTRAHQLAGAR